MAYNLTQLKKDITQIVDTKLDDLKNGFKSELTGEIKIQMAASWESISGAVENKIAAETIKLTTSVDRFQKDAGEKLEYFSLILAKMNDVSGGLKELKGQREICLKDIVRLQTQANGWGPTIKDLAERVNTVEDKPGKKAIRAWDKIKWIVLGTGIPAVIYGLFRLVEYVT